MPIRQAAAIYFKNYITKNWHHIETDFQHQESKIVIIIESDKIIIKDNIIEAIIHSPDILRSQLALCVNTMIKYDYPNKWPKLLNKLEIFLKDNNYDICLGGLNCLHQLVKNYEYRKSKDRVPLYNCLSKILPILGEKFSFLLNDNSEQSVAIQKHIFKTFYCAIQFQLPPLLMNQMFLSSWMQICLTSLNIPLPQHVNDLEEDERASSVWWKCKKWILHILCRICERYGTPAIVSKEYKDFAHYYMITFTTPLLETILKFLDFYRQGNYVSPRVINFCFAYLSECLIQSYCWKLLKPHVDIIIREIIFKLMKYDDEDEFLWENDPIEYIRTKFDIYEDFVSPVTAAKDFLFALCSKRQGMLHQTVNYCVSDLSTSPHPSYPLSLDTSSENKFRAMDGYLNMIGTLADALIANASHSSDTTKNAKKNESKDYSHITYILVNFVCPLLTHPKGYLRARACWMVHQFKKIKYDPSQTDNLISILNSLIELLLRDPCLPVKVEASIAIKSLVSRNEKAKEALIPRLKEILSELLNILKLTLNEEMTIVLKKIICIYSDQVKPLILEMLKHTYSILDTTHSRKEDEEVRMFVSGLLEIIETLIDLLDDNKDAINMVSDTVMEIVNLVLNKFHSEDYDEDFYDELISICYALTCHIIPTNAWSLLPILYGIFLKDKESFFTEMLSIWHNFITNDTESFLSDPSRLQITFAMCQNVISDPEHDDDMELHALKLFEVLLFQCTGRQEQLIPPSLEIVFKRLWLIIGNKNKLITNNELETNNLTNNKNGLDDESEKDDKISEECKMMNLQIVIACFFINPQLTLNKLTILEKEFRENDSRNANNINFGPISFIDKFVDVWMQNIEYFLGLHDNKVCALGLCTLINLPAESRQHITSIQKHSPKFISSLIKILEDIKKINNARIQNSESSWEDADETNNADSSDDDDIDAIKTLLNDDQDDFDESKQKYLEAVSPSATDINTDAAASGDSENHPEIDMQEGEGTTKINEEYEEEGDEEETVFEAFTCIIDKKDSPIDEFLLFKNSLQNIQINDPNFYSQIISNLTNSQIKRLNDLFQIADKRKATLGHK
ncbi:unnamed protein product [Gordionus sp. m RMFG-2023]